MPLILQADNGRDFLIRVPGVAMAPIGDLELTQLMNWLVEPYAADLNSFSYYTVEEVNTLRNRPLINIKSARSELARSLKAKGVTLPPLSKSSDVNEYSFVEESDDW